MVVIHKINQWSFCYLFQLTVIRYERVSSLKKKLKLFKKCTGMWFSTKGKRFQFSLKTV